MKYKGVHYDVGVEPLGRERPSRPVFDAAVVRREIEIIQSDLHCNAVRIVGRDLGRVILAAEQALERGLHVWLSPALDDAGPRETLAHLVQCARAAEALRQRSPNVVLVVGCELTFFMSGLVMGDTGPERMQTFMRPWRLLLSTLVKGSFNWRLNRFLQRAVAAVREQFKGPVTYASGVWEDVDWQLFDLVAVDSYRDAGNEQVFRKNLRRYFQHGKPVVITEFGCCTYRGADEKGGYGWAIVDWAKEPPQLNGIYSRDEPGQAEYLVELLDIFEEEGADGAFVFTFIAPKYPHTDDPSTDLDMASYALVRTVSDRRGQRYPDMPWEPKIAFDVVAERFLARRG